MSSKRIFIACGTTLALVLSSSLLGETKQSKSPRPKKSVNSQISQPAEMEKSRTPPAPPTSNNATNLIAPATPSTIQTTPTPTYPEPSKTNPYQIWILSGTFALIIVNTLLFIFLLLRSKTQNLESPKHPAVSDLERLSKAFAGLHEALDKKDEEIGRHQRGYDQKILKTLLGRLVQVQLFLDDAMAEKPPKESTVQSVADELAMVLDEYGIRTHDPKGELYRTTPGVATNPKTTPTDHAEEKGRIAEVRQKGFFLKTPAGDEVLLPAKVTIYV